MKIIGTMVLLSGLLVSVSGATYFMQGRLEWVTRAMVWTDLALHAIWRPANEVPGRLSCGRLVPLRDHIGLGTLILGLFLMGFGHAIRLILAGEAR